MTIAVGFLCTDGAVVGADGAHTFAVAPGVNTIEQHGKKKLDVSDETIVTSSGFVGDAQRVTNVVENTWKQRGGIKKAEPLRIGREFAAAVTKDFRNTGVTRSTHPQFPAFPAALVACATSNGPVLVEYEATRFQPEVKSIESTWHVCIGNGQQIGDPFLAFLATTLMQGTAPTVAQAKVMAYWTLRHACEVNTGGIGPEIQMAVIELATAASTAGRGNWRARELSGDEMSLVRGNVEAIKSVMAASWPAVAESDSASVVPEQSRAG